MPLPAYRFTTKSTRATTALPVILNAGVVLLLTGVTRADTFGSGPDQFTINFVTIGNLGNADDPGAGGGTYSSAYGGVRYSYRMGVKEVPQDWTTKATNLGITNVNAGAWTGRQPAARNHPLSPQQREDNRLIVAVRAGIENIFGHWKRVLGWRRMRYLGHAKGTLELQPKSMAWNLKRLVTLCAA
jgi:hypothetical protein